MSPSKLIKISLVALFLALPIPALGKTLTWQDQKWDVDVTLGTTAVQAPYLRNNFEPLDLARQSLFGGQIADRQKPLSASSARELMQVAAAIDRPAQDARLIISQGRAQQFSPGQDGQLLDLYRLSRALQSDAVVLSLPVAVSEPTVPLAATNSLGIQELVASGESDFSGSPKNRLVNIDVGAAKFNGLIIKPGDEFSFNTYLGDVDAEHGFLPELVIKSNDVIPEFGGGLCQVSSTAFRAAMNAGLPITARRNHSFAVQYYAPQGTDATIYPGVQDLKFINNLNSNLLIWTRIEGHKLYFDFYGTKDARTVTFEGPYQYDKKPDGSMKATWTRHVTINDETTTQTFNSTYLPPALFEHDSEEQASTPNPQAPADSDSPTATPTPSPTPTPTPTLTQDL